MKHRQAVETALKAGAGRITDADAPLVELARALADQIDSAGPDGPGTRLAGTYLTTLRTLVAITGRAAPAPVGRLAELRAQRERPAPSKKRRTS